VVRHHTLGNYGEADLSPVRSWVLDRVGHQPTSWARAFANFRELRNGEVRRINQPVEKVVIGPVGSPKPHPNT
jgi:hypothetical protein